MKTISNQDIMKRLKVQFSEGLTDWSEPDKTLTFSVAQKLIIGVITFLKNDKELNFNFLTDICGAHFPKNTLPLSVIYHLHSLTNRIRLRIKVFLPLAAPSVPSLTPLFAAANWMERETYDFYGIIFEGHPKLQRILNMDDMEAFPMRKEYPLEDPNRTDKDDTFFGR